MPAPADMPVAITMSRTSSDGYCTVAVIRVLPPSSTSFMPTLARPDVDVLDGLTTAIIVDQERMGANARSTVGTATDATAMLRILFSRLGKPHIGSPNAYSSTSPR